MREAYRKNKSELWESILNENYSLAIAFIYTGSKAMSYAQIEKKIIDIQQRLMAVDMSELPASPD